MMRQEIEEDLRSNDDQKIVSILFAISRYGGIDDYEYVLELCDRFYNHPNINVRTYVLYALGSIKGTWNKIDLNLFIKIMKYACAEGNYEITFAYHDVCSIASLDERIYIRDQLQDYYEKFELSKYDKLFVSEELKEKSLAKVKEGEKNFKFCCSDMRDAFDRKLIDCDIINRYYDINGHDIIFCIWCGRYLGTNLCNEWCGKYLGISLYNEWRDILESEYGLNPIDSTYYTNVPDEFKTDLWWRRRFVVNSVNVKIDVYRFLPKCALNGIMVTAEEYEDKIYPEEKLKRIMPIHIVPFVDCLQEICCPNMTDHVSVDGKYRGELIDYIPHTRTYILKLPDEKENERDYIEEEKEKINEQGKEVEKRKELIEKKETITKEMKHCPWCSLDISSLANERIRILDEEYSIIDPDGIDKERVPIEFKTDHWWRERKLHL